MRTNLTAAAIVAASFAGITGAQAADVYSPGGYKDAPVAAQQAPTWSGFILGLTGSGQFVNHDVKVNYADVNLAELNGLSGVGPGIGVLVGARWQFPSSRFTVGVEGEADWTSAPVNLSLYGSQGAAFEMDSRWDVTGVVGFVINPNTLAYIGAGWGQISLHPSGLIQSIGDKTVDGGVIKTGMETKLPWLFEGAFARAQYKYFAGNQTTLVDFRDGEISYGNITDTVNVSEAKVAIGIQFGGGYTPLK